MKHLSLLLLFCALAGAQTKAKTAPKAAANGPDLLNPSTMRASAPAVFVVRLDTTKGPIEIRVTKSWAPAGADRFYNLVRAGFFTDASFFRVIKGFMAQFGMSARPEVNKVWANRNIVDDRVLQSNKRGMVSFANTGSPNSRGTQMFINMVDNTFLDGMLFAPFGEVISGMDVVDMLYSGYGEAPSQGEIARQGKPYLDKNFPRLDRILKATIVPASGK
jgi:peptidyl-prolyl cis-trans isomerase A (cyclophilin A)